MCVSPTNNDHDGQYLCFPAYYTGVAFKLIMNSFLMTIVIILCYRRDDFHTDDDDDYNGGDHISIVVQRGIKN